MGDVPGALEHYGRALSLRERVAAADTHDARAQETVARAHLSIGQVLRGAARPLEAIQHFRQALEIASNRYAADPSNGAAAERLANVYGALGRTSADLASSTKSKTEATPHWRDARAWAQNGADLLSARLTKSALSKSGQEEFDSLLILVAKCDAALR
jgi:tetratricopeptide (TPR) repeat protein